MSWSAAGSSHVTSHVHLDAALFSPSCVTARCLNGAAISSLTHLVFAITK